MSVTQTSIDAAIMDEVLVRMGEIITLSTSLRGYRAPDDLPEGGLPFCQVWNPSTTIAETDYQSERGTLVFFLQLIVAKSQEDTVRDAIEALAVDLTRNPLSDSAVRIASVSTRGVFERTEDETTVGEAIVTVEYAQDFVVTGDVDLVDLVGDFGSLASAGGTIEISPEIPDAIGIRKQSAIVLTVTLQMLSPFPGLPSDWSVFPFIRYGVFIPRSVAGKISNTILQIFASDFKNSQWEFDDLVCGWNEILVDISSPDTTTGPDLTDIFALQLAFEFLLVTDVQDEHDILVRRFFYTPRDKDGDDVADGF